MLRGRSVAKFDRPDKDMDAPDKEMTFFVGECDGLRKLVSVAVLKYALTAHIVTDSLVKHIVHRFSQPGASEELQQAELQPLPEGATQEDMVRKWAAVMAGTGAISCTQSTQNAPKMLFGTKVKQNAHALKLFEFITMYLLVVGWGDTATMIVLPHVLYIDTFVWIPPHDDVQLPKLPQKFKPLRFRRGKESSTRNLYLRFINNHFVVYKPRTAGTGGCVANGAAKWIVHSSYSTLPECTNASALAALCT
jgi:hypothetical protein